ncbi:MAG TPA: hypothetical protein PKH23_04575, partial [Bacillota bacterium]|nr:hypothetical protein [Bacillota bacterium]
PSRVSLPKGALLEYQAFSPLSNGFFENCGDFQRFSEKDTKSFQNTAIPGFTGQTASPSPEHENSRPVAGNAPVFLF